MQIQSNEMLQNPITTRSNEVSSTHKVITQGKSCSRQITHCRKNKYAEHTRQAVYPVRSSSATTDCRPPRSEIDCTSRPSSPSHLNHAAVGCHYTHTESRKQAFVLAHRRSPQGYAQIFTTSSACSRVSNRYDDCLQSGPPCEIHCESSPGTD